MPALFAFLDNPVMLLILGVIAVLLFGERLPEVARSAGKGLMELKRGVRSIQDDMESAINSASTSSSSSSSSSPSLASPYDHSEDREEATAPKFEPPSP
jgi:sec-independent protein translocase protein TatA